MDSPGSVFTDALQDARQHRADELCRTLIVHLLMDFKGVGRIDAPWFDDVSHAPTAALRYTLKPSIALDRLRLQYLPSHRCSLPGRAAPHLLV